jgi:hypothetical protein
LDMPAGPAGNMPQPDALSVVCGLRMIWISGAFIMPRIPPP